jgi:transposase
MTDPKVQALVLTLYYSDKRSMESIARELGINRKTVIRIVRRREVLLERPRFRRKSQLDPYKDILRAQLQKDPKVTGTALLNQLRSLSYTGGVTVLRDYLLKERGQMLRPREAYLRLDFGPGEVAQVDWGEFGDVFGEGVKIHCFAMVLAFSRMIYVEFTRSEKFEEFIRCHENAFKFFGGAPRECWYDNLATAVSDRIGSLIRFNARFMAYMAHHGVRPHACNVARGNEKGRVEDLIKYIRMNFWGGRKFTDFDDLTKQSIVWRNQIANQREHRSTRRVVRLYFEAEEQKALLVLNPVPYDTDEIFSRQVGSDFHLQYETNRYSVPWTLTGMTVTVRVNQNELKVYYHEKFICSHRRSYLKNKVFTTEAHRTGLLERKPGASRDTWQLSYIKNLGPRMAEYVDLVRQGPRSLKYELSRLIGLVTVYGRQTVLQACEECLSHGIVGVDNLELFLKRQQHPSERSLNPNLINFNNERLNRVHPEIDLRKYDALYFEGEKQMSASEVKDNGSNEQGPSSGDGGLKAQVLGADNDGGFGEDAGEGSDIDHQVYEQLGSKGEVGALYSDDPIQDPDGQVPSSSDGGEF